MNVLSAKARGGRKDTRWTPLVGCEWQELPPRADRCLLGIVHGVEQADEVRLAVRLNTDGPATGARVEADAANTAARCAPWVAVLHLLGVADHAEVLPAVVETVAIPVVALSRVARFKAKEKAVHLDPALLGDRVAVVQSPRPTREEVVVGVIHQSHGTHCAVATT